AAIAGRAPGERRRTVSVAALLKPRRERFARRLRARLGDEDVARTRGEEVGHVEAAGAALHARDALLEQQRLDQLRLRLVGSTADLHERPPGVLGLDLPSALLAISPLGLAAALVHEGHPAVLAEALARRVRAGAGRAEQRLAAHPPGSPTGTSSMRPSSIR